MSQQENELLGLNPTDENIHAVYSAEDDARIERVRAENKVLLVAGYAVVLTPSLIVVLAFLANANGFELRIDSKILAYCLSAGAVVISYLFGKNVFLMLWRQNKK